MPDSDSAAAENTVALPVASVTATLTTFGPVEAVPAAMYVSDGSMACRPVAVAPL